MISQGILLQVRNRRRSVDSWVCAPSETIGAELMVKDVTAGVGKGTTEK